MSLADVTLGRCRMENICSLGRCCSLLPAQSTSYSHLVKQTPLNWSYSCSWSTINLVYTPTSQTLLQDSPSLSSGLISCGRPCLPLIYPPCLPSVPDLEFFLSILVLLVAVRCFHSTTALQCESFLRSTDFHSVATSALALRASCEDTPAGCPILCLHDYVTCLLLHGTIAWYWTDLCVSL